MVLQPYSIIFSFVFSLYLYFSFIFSFLTYDNDLIICLFLPQKRTVSGSLN